MLSFAQVHGNLDTPNHYDSKRRHFLPSHHLWSLFCHSRRVQRAGWTNLFSPSARSSSAGREIRIWRKELWWNAAVYWMYECCGLTGGIVLQ